MKLPEGWEETVEQAKYAPPEDMTMTRTIMCTRQAFTGQPELLYDALIYAAQNNVAVLFVPVPDHIHADELVDK